MIVGRPGSPVFAQRQWELWSYPPYRTTGARRSQHRHRKDHLLYNGVVLARLRTASVVCLLNLQSALRYRHLAFT